MKTNKPLFWILTSEHGVMCRDHCWRKMAAGVEEIKRFRSIGWVNRFCRFRGHDWEAFAVYEGNELDCCGRIFRDGKYTLNDKVA